MVLLLGGSCWFKGVRDWDCVISMMCMHYGADDEVWKGRKRRPAGTYDVFDTGAV